MPNTFNLISSVTATTGTSISFTNIPQTYTDLYLISSARTTYTGGGSVSMTLSFNSVGTGYASRYIQYYGATSVVSGNDSTTTFGGITGGLIRAFMPSAGGTSNIFSNTSLYIPNYKSSDNKTYHIEATSEDNAASGTSVNGIVSTAGLWSNTSAITSISLGLEVGSLVSPSTFYLYGIIKS